MADVLEEIKEIFNNQIKIKGIFLNIVDETPKILISNDERRIKQMLVNLITNSVKFTF